MVSRNGKKSLTILASYFRVYVPVTPEVSFKKKLVFNHVHWITAATNQWWAG